MPYAALLPYQGGVHTGGAPPAFRGGLLRHVTPEAARVLAEGVRSGAAQVLQIRSVAGAVNDVDPLATAYAHRRQNFGLTAVGRSARRDALDRVGDELAPHVSGLTTASTPTRGRSACTTRSPARRSKRLRRLKARYDPDNAFNQNFALPPALASAHA